MPHDMNTQVKFRYRYKHLSNANGRKCVSLPPTDFNAVDASANTSQLVKYLERSNLAPLARFSRAQLIRLLQPRSGEHILDVGCGIGYSTQAIATQVGKKGRVVGIDSSRTMIEECLKRSSPLHSNLNFRVADAHLLPFARDTFDACLAVSTLIHLDDPRKALGEILRVLKPGGRFAVLEPDWDTFVLEVGLPTVSSTVVRLVRKSVRNSGIGHQLPVLLRLVGMNILSVDAATLLASDFQLANDAWRIQSALSYAMKARLLSHTNGPNILRQLKNASKSGSFFAASTGFATIASKPMAI